MNHGNNSIEKKPSRELAEARRLRLVKRLGVADAQTMQLVNEAIEISLGLMNL